jgi:hypothetical protein
MRVMILATGPKTGRAILPFTTLGNFLTANMKSKDLFCSAQYKSLAAKGTPYPVVAE